MLALRTALTIASGWRNEPGGEEIGAIVGDVTQAFVHADMDELIITRVPKELDGIKIQNGDDETVLYEGMWLIVLKALYGYRKSPKLWQAHFLKVLMELTCVNLMCLKSEPVMFADMKNKAVDSSR